MIGNFLKNLYTYFGYHVVSINHLGDWGTQFGKIIVAIQHWGTPDVLTTDTLSQIQKLYVRFHEEVQNDPTLDDQARLVSSQLEQGNPEYLAIWKTIRQKSILEFKKMYRLLQVRFDYLTGESFFNNKMAKVLHQLAKQHLTEIDEGALLVRLPDPSLPPALLTRSDGTTLYLTRDLSALLYRYRKFSFHKILYVVGSEQKLHFQQLGLVAKMLHPEITLEHIDFGLVLINNKKMSTREGGFAKLEDVIHYIYQKVLAQIEAKNPHLKNKEKIAKQIAVGAVIFNDLKNDRTLNVNYDLDALVKFEGLTGPYVMYTAVRLRSILHKWPIDPQQVDYSLFDNPLYYRLIKPLINFEPVLKRCLENNQPSFLSKYLLRLCQDFNTLYNAVKILDPLQPQTTNTLLLLLRYVLQVIEQGMQILGISLPEQM
jgi:arginyl-tRNA synthetase